MPTLSGARAFVERVASDFTEKNVTFMAAGIAYNAFISLAPMLLLLFVVLSAIGGGVEEHIVELTGRWLPGPIAEIIRELFRGETSTGGASFIGLVVLTWGTLKIFRGLDTAFSEIYETTGDNSFTDKLRDGAVVFVALVVAVVATIGVSAAFAVFSNSVPQFGALSPLVLFGGLVVAFFPIYYVFPDTEVGVWDVLPGVVFAAVAWTAFQGLFQVYLTFSDPGSGSFFGGVIVVVTYLYFSALVLLVGAVVNAVLGAHSTAKPGGVGQAAAGYETERDSSMSRDELGDYLRGLREDVAGHYEEMRPRTEDGERRPPPAGDIDVTERSRGQGDRRRWTVTLQWETVEREQDADDRSGDADEHEN